MDTMHGETMLERLAARLDELEQANMRLKDEVAALRAERRAAQPTGRVHKAQPQGADERNGRPSRRGMLRTLLGVAAATVGAGALVETQTGTALAQPCACSSFTSSGFPAVTTSGTKGATGISASSDSGTGVFAQSHGGTAVWADGGTGGTGVKVIGDVALDVDGRLKIKGPVGTATLPAGMTSIPVSNTAVTPNSTILLTPVGDPGGPLWIDPPTAGGFTIHISAEEQSEHESGTPPTPVTVNYLIIN